MNPYTSFELKQLSVLKEIIFSQLFKQFLVQIDQIEDGMLSIVLDDNGMLNPRSHLT